METRRLTSLLVTVFAALAVLYPMTTAIRGSWRSSAQATAPKNEIGSPEAVNAAFPTAVDLVSEFLFTEKEKQGASAGKPSGTAYTIDFLIATAPDPISSRLPHFFDSFVESLQRAAQASGYTIDRSAFPWSEKGSGAPDDLPPWHQQLYETTPGLVLFRDPQSRQLLLVFLVGETPTTGIQKQAMFSALEQMAQFYPWHPKHADLPPGFPEVAPGFSPAPESPPGASPAHQSPSVSSPAQVSPPGRGPESGATFRIMGPAFSGSAVSLRFALDKWSRSRSDYSRVHFQIISGTATAIDPAWLSQSAEGHTTFQAAVPPDGETLQAIGCYINGLGYQKIAILTEGNTAYGQHFARQSTPGKASAKLGGCWRGQTPPDILTLPFPMHISRLRVATSKAQQQAAAPETVSGNPLSTPLEQGSAAESREALPAFSTLSVQSAELTLSNLLSAIAREQFSYVGIVATDVRDVTFLAQEVRQHAPATILFTLNSDLLYAYPDVNSATRGMIVITPYPLFNLEQLWTYAYGGAKSRLQFSNQAAEGVYNATLALLHQDEKLVDYGRPLAGSANPGESHKPSLWVTAVGNEETLPVRLLPWEDASNYTYSPALASAAGKRRGEPSVGRGIYAENSVVALIVLSIFLSVFSLLMVSQYQRPEKTGVVRFLTILGDTVSPAYRSECRLFLLGCCVSLLAFYIVVVTAYCLPFITGRELDAGIQTTTSSQIAAGIAGVTLLVLLLASVVMVLAFRKAPAGQRGSAPEVVTFSLFSCVLIVALTVGLGTTWISDVRQNPVDGLFTHLRSFDLGGGLSPLLPLSLVATGACLWALCSFRRLRLLDVLRATETAEGPNSSLNFLALNANSFSGVRELEESVKQTLESSSVISLPSYLLLMGLSLSAGTYFFTTRLVRALEAPSFYWVFETAFIIVYWALLMEFLRLVFAWRSLHMLLQRLSWHPLLTAFKRYRENRPNLAKMNLTRPPSVFAALESSVNQARRLIRTAQTLAMAPNLDDDLRSFFRQSLPEWEAEVQAAGSHLCEALRSEWAGESPEETRSLVDMVRRKRANRIRSDWRQSLIARAHAHRALFRLLQSQEKVMEEYWSCGRAQDATVTPAPDAKEFFQQVEEFTVSRVVNFLALVFPSLQNLEYFVLAGLLLMLLAVTAYPFQPRNEFLFFNWVVILSFIGTAVWIFVQMDRDTVLSLLNDTKPGQINVSRELVLRLLLYVAVPLLALLGAQFPESLRQILSVFTAQASS